MFGDSEPTSRLAETKNKFMQPSRRVDDMFCCPGLSSAIEYTPLPEPATGKPEGIKLMVSASDARIYEKEDLWPGLTLRRVPCGGPSCFSPHYTSGSTAFRETEFSSVIRVIWNINTSGYPFLGMDHQSRKKAKLPADSHPWSSCLQMPNGN